MSRNAFAACAKEIEDREDERNNLRMERQAALPRVKLADYLKIHPDYRGIWSSDRSDLKGWNAKGYMGKRTYMNKGALEVEGISFVIEE